MHQNYFRDYRPELGRYLESDPIGLEGGINLWGYGNQNPYYYMDVDAGIPLVLPAFCLANPPACAGAVGTGLYLIYKLLPLSGSGSSTSTMTETTDKKCETCEIRYPSVITCAEVGYTIKTFEEAKARPGVGAVSNHREPAKYGPCAYGNGAYHWNTYKPRMPKTRENNMASIVSCECCAEENGKAELTVRYEVIYGRFF